MLRFFPSTCLLALATALTHPAAAQTVLFSEDFESGASAWTFNELWHVVQADSPCTTALAPFPSGTHCAWFGSETTCTFAPTDTGNEYLTLTTPIELPASAESALLQFSTWSEAEDDTGWDLRHPELSTDGGAHWFQLPDVWRSHWVTQRYDLSQWIGTTIRLRFRFWAGDPLFNDTLGWLIDDVRIETGVGPATTTCTGDGTWSACPCGNSGATGRGCATSFNPAGAGLASTGVARTGADTVTMIATGLSNASATLFQGIGNSNSDPFVTHNGDGLICVQGSLVRIQSVLAQGGTATFPSGGASISTRGFVGAGATYTYQVRFRNSASFCTPATYNFTNSQTVHWRL
ncbi:MAG: hypothetical protein IPJ77_10685 [Planctomycetes bacterium]|nr:hypothetical protein [Planctomycetota bacterium]